MIVAADPELLLWEGEENGVEVLYPCLGEARVMGWWTVGSQVRRYNVSPCKIELIVDGKGITKRSCSPLHDKLAIHISV